MNSRSFVVKNPPFRPSQPRCDPFFALHALGVASFRPSRPQNRHFRHFHPPTRAPALQKQDFPAVSPFSRPLRARPVGESGPFSAGCHPELVEGSRPTHTVAPQEFRRELSTPALRACAQVDPSSPPPANPIQPSFVHSRVHQAPPDLQNASKTIMLSAR